MSNPANERTHQNYLRHFFDDTVERRRARRRMSVNSSPPPSRPSTIQELYDNNPDFRELQLSSTHALLDCGSLLQAIRQNRTVESVEIHGFFVEKLSAIHQKRLWKAVGSLPKLKELTFNYFLDCSLTTEALNLVLDRALGLTSICMHDSKFSLGDGGKPGTRPLHLVSLEHHTALKTIYITQLSLSGETLSLDPFVTMILSAPNLQKITFRMALRQGNHLLSESTLDMLAQKDLRTLELRKLVLDNQSIIRLMRNLTPKKESKGNVFGTTIKDLILESDEVLNEEACVAISKMLQSNNTLERLDLWGSHLDETGLVAIANSLKQNRTLRVFHLSHKNISAKGQVALVDMLRQNYYLESMFLRSYGNIAFINTIDFYLKMNTTYIRRLLLNVNVDRGQIFDKLVVHTNKVDYLFHLLRGNPSFLSPQ